jgi:hypothetical protein
MKKIKRRSTPKKQNRQLAPRTVDEYFAQPEQFRDKWNRVAHVPTLMRSGELSFSGACREVGLSQKAVLQLARPAFRKQRNGRYKAKSVDHLLRVIVLPIKGQLQEIGLNDSREATLAGKLWVAIERYLDTGDEAPLRKIRRKTLLDANGKRIRFVRDFAELDRLASAGVLRFDSIYPKVA